MADCAYCQLFKMCYIKVAQYFCLFEYAEERPLLSSQDCSYDEYWEHESICSVYTDDHDNKPNDDLDLSDEESGDICAQHEEDVDLVAPSTSFVASNPADNVNASTAVDVPSSREEFATVANNIYLAYNHPRDVFKLLYSISSKLLSSNTEHRTLDPSNHMVFDHETDETDESGAIKQWLRLLGFEPQPDTGLFVCAHDEPSKAVIDTAQSVCKLWINKCDKSLKVLHHIHKYSKSCLDISHIKLHHAFSPGNESETTESDDAMAIPKKWSVSVELQEEDEKDDDDDDDDASADTIEEEHNRFRLQQLIWSVTHYKNTEHENISDVLLLCMPVFTSPKEVMQLLNIRFLEREQEHTLHEHWEIQQRVVAFMQNWMVKYYYQDFYLNPSVEQLTEEFMDAMRSYFEVRNDMQRGLSLPDRVESTMESQLRQLEQKGIIVANEIRISKLTKVLGPRMMNLESVKNKKASNRVARKEFDTFYSSEVHKIGQQLVLISFKYFHGIQPRECLEQNWKGPEKEQRAPNILKVIKHFNAISNYVQVTILKAPSANKRAKWITKWLQIGEILLEFHDFETLAAIHGALTSQAIYRQSIAWKKVPGKYIDKFDEFKVIYHSRGGHCNLRKIHNETPPPMVPYVGVLLQVLFQIDEANKNQNEDGSVNFSKLMRLHSAIQRITALQNTSYDEIIKIDAGLQEFITHCMTKYAHITSDEMYEQSTEALNKDDPKRLQNKK